MLRLAASHLRVIDFGVATALRSQTLWHAIAYGVSAGAAPTLSFVRPSAGYVGLGYHRSLDEVDESYCRSRGLPIYRRMVGGGPVYLDSDQLFFQICLPSTAVSPSRVAAIRELLSPAVTAFRAVGVPAELDSNLEISLGTAKICGHGAGQIEEAVVVCGNLIQRFDHERAAQVLRLPDETMRAETLRLMRRYVVATAVDADAFRPAMVDAFAEALGLSVLDGELSAFEEAKLTELDALFTSPAWIRGPRDRPPDRARQVKVRAGVWVFASEQDGARVVASVVNGALERAWLQTTEPDAEMRRAERALSGVALSEAPGVLAGFGVPGRQLAAAFAAADGRRL